MSPVSGNLRQSLASKRYLHTEFQAGQKHEFRWRLLLNRHESSKGMEVTINIDDESKDFKKCKIYFYDYTFHRVSNNLNSSRKNFSVELVVSMNEQISQTMLRRSSVKVGDVFIINMIFENEPRPETGPTKGSSLIPQNLQDFEDLLESGHSQMFYSP